MHSTHGLPHLTLPFTDIAGILITQDPDTPDNELHLYLRNGTQHTFPIRGSLLDSLKDLHPALESHHIPVASSSDQPGGIVSETVIQST